MPKYIYSDVDVTIESLLEALEQDGFDLDRPFEFVPRDQNDIDKGLVWIKQEELELVPSNRRVLK